MAISIVSLYRQLFGRKGPRSGTDIDMSEHGRVGGVSTEQGFKYSRFVDEKVSIDSATSSITYVGKAKMGEETDEASWQIMKIEESGTVTSFTFADGDEEYDNVWDDRATLDYS